MIKDPLLHNLSDLSIKHDKALKMGLFCNDELFINLVLLKYADLSCLSSKEIRKFKGIIDTITYDCYLKQPRVKVDSSNKELWEELYPECINRKEWERIAYKICNKYKIEVDVEKISTMCDITFEILKDITSCDVLTAISLQQKICNYNVDITINENQCKIDYKLLIEKNPICNLTLKEYITLIKKGYSYEILSTIYDNNSYLEINSKGIVILNTKYSKYELPNDLKFKELIVKDGNLELPKRMLEDFNINTKIKKQILDEIHIL